MTHIKLEEAKITLLQGIRLLASIADHQKDKHIIYGLQVQAASLENLGSCVELCILPEEFVRSVIEDVRLEVLVLLADLKASLAVQNQRTISSSQNLDGKPDEAIAALEAPLAPQETEVDPAPQTSRIISDLLSLKRAENSLQNCLQ